MFSLVLVLMVSSFRRRVLPSVLMLLSKKSAALLRILIKGAALDSILGGLSPVKSSPVLCEGT